MKVMVDSGERYLSPFLDGLDDQYASQQIRVTAKVLGSWNLL
jgi:hypothetical protein